MASSVQTGLPEELPADVAALAEERGLGDHKATYRPARMALWRVIIAFIMVLIGFLVILPGLYFIWFLSQQPNFNKKQAAKRLHLFQNGFVVTEPGKPAKAFRAASTSVLQEIVNNRAYGVSVGTAYTYRLTGADGVTAKVTNFFERPEEWGSSIQDIVTRAKLPDAVAALESGETLTFGDYSVSESGLSHSKRGTIEWQEIGDFTVKNGWLSVSKPGAWKTWSSTELKKIPDVFVFVFIAIAEHHLNT